jgi:hypothetical protein
MRITQKEIDERINNGESLIITFFIKHFGYNVGNIRITEKQYNSAKERFANNLELKTDFSGITKHYYTLIKNVSK